MTLKRLGKLLKGNMFLFVSAMVCMAIVAILQMVNPIILQIAVDNVIDDKPLNTNFVFTWLINCAGGLQVLRGNIWLCSGALLLLALLIGTFIFFRGRNAAVAGENIAKKLKDNLFNHLQKLPYNYHVKAQAGDLIQRCTSDVETVRRFLHQQTIEIARALFFLIFSIAVMSTVNIKMTLVALIFIPFIFLFSYVFFYKVKKAFKASDEKEGELSTVLQENLSGVRVVRAFGRERFEMDKFSQRNDSLKDLNFKVIQYLAYYWSLSDILCFLQIALVLIYGIYLTSTGEITTGQLIMFNSYEGMLVWPVRQLGRVLSDMGKMQVALSRIYEILDTPAETDTEGAAAHGIRGDIIFNKVCFEYEAGNSILKDLSFTVKKGETIAVLGTTGSGKSTLMHILLRLYDYNSGSIQINGRELKLISKNHLREKIGMVLQEPFLFSKTIKENLLMAKYNVNDEEIYDATRTASVHDVIEDFENGYDTIVGEKGVTLSGGQKQRVAIARTLIKNSDILIFDDSLSAVDTETDAQIRAALNEKNKDVTTFIISQRITTLMNADRIFVIENGTLSDSGTHSELIARDGLYSRIWNIQSMLEDDFYDNDLALDLAKDADKKEAIKQ